MPKVDIVRQPPRRSRKKQTSQARALLDRRPSPESRTPPSSPERTAEYWDKCVLQLEEKRAARQAASRNPQNKSSSQQQCNAVVLDIISSYEGVQDSPTIRPLPSQTSEMDATLSPAAFDFGFSSERGRADSAHEAEPLKLHLQKSSKDISSTLHCRTPTRTHGLRKEGQTLASTAPITNLLKDLAPEESSEREKDQVSSKPRQRPPRPPRPDDAAVVDLSPTPASAITVSRRPVPPSESSVPSQLVPPEEKTEAQKGDILTSSRPARSGSLATAAPLTPAIPTEPAPSANVPPNASYALQQTVSVFEDYDEKTGLMDYVKWTLHASKNSFSGDRDRKDKEKKEKVQERDREKHNAHQTNKLGRTGRRSTFRQAVVRVLGCSHGKTDEG